MVFSKPLVPGVVAVAALLSMLVAVRARQIGGFSVAVLAVIAIGAASVVKVVDAGVVGWSGYFLLVLIPVTVALTSLRIVGRGRPLHVRLAAGVGASIIAIPLGAYVSLYLTGPGL
jgi:hypothetical protein